MECWHSSKKENLVKNHLAMAYNNWGQLAVYDNMGVALFVNGYFTGLGEESDAIKGFMLAYLQEVMEDADVYGWECVRSYRLAWDYSR